jgi:hypothetical protein
MILAIKWVSVIKYRGKILQLTVELQNGLIKRLVDMGISMLAMVAWIV